MKLSHHFSLHELTKSDTAIRLGIDNTPSDAEIDNLIQISENILEPIRQRYSIPFSPTSGYRCLELNRALSSKDTSQHITGNAVDIVIPSVSTEHLFNFIKDELVFDQLILEHLDEDDIYSGWIHCSYIVEKINRSEAFMLP